MGLRYGDQFPSTEREPECFGRSAYYNPRDSDCRRCPFMDDCGDEIRSRRGGPSRSSRPSERSTSGIEVQGEAGDVQEEETATNRFFRDCLTGACRGALWEGYQFFKRFRF